MTIAERIKNKREELGLSQSDLARIAGLKAPGISQYESGLRNPSYEALIKLSSALGVSTDFLVSGHDLKNSKAQEKTEIVLHKVINRMNVESRKQLLDYAIYLGSPKQQKPSNIFLLSPAEYGEHVFKTIGVEALPVDIHKIACNLNVSVIDGDLNGEAEASIFISENSYIVIDKKVTHMQRRRFIIAALLGHIIMPWHLKSTYMIRRKGSSTLATENIDEIEAQEFASCLLMPANKMIGNINLDNPSLKEIRTLAYEKYDVSLFSFLNRLVEIDKNKFAVVQSKNTEIIKTYQGSRAIVENVHENSFAYSFSEKPATEEEFRGGVIPAEYWFSDIIPGEMIYEESVFNPEYKAVLTLLISR